jgi:glycosyltransferase involved in cell wall biosynthesis
LRAPIASHDGSDPRVKVAIYVPHGAVPDKRGFAPSIVAWNQARRLRSARPVIISALEEYSSTQETVDGVTIYRIRESGVYRRLFRKMTRLDPYPLHRRAAKIVNRESPDLFHSHQLEFPVADFLRALKRKIPVIVHAHVTAGRFDETRGIADRYLAVSQHVKEKLVTEKNFPPSRVEVLPNGVDSELFAPPLADEMKGLRSALNIPRDALIITFVGRKQEVKGFHIFLQVVEKLLGSHRQLYVLVAGPEPGDSRRERTFAMRQQAVERLRKTGRYSEFSALPQAELAKIIKVTDIMLVPSLSEPQGMVMLEAMACGCLVISSNTGGIKESLCHGETGYLLEHPDDLEDVTAVLENCVNRFDSFSGIRRAARQTVISKFDWTAVTARLERVYMELAGQGCMR